MVSVQEILDNPTQYYFNCEGRVQEVRDFLENVVGFTPAAWETKHHINLKYLYMDGREPYIKVHGSLIHKLPQRTLLDIEDVAIDEYSYCKQINLSDSDEPSNTNT